MKELLCRMRLFSCGSEAEKGAIGQEVTGTSRHSNGRHFDESRPKTRLVRATTEIRRSRQRRRPLRCELLHDGRNCKSAKLGCGAVRATLFIFRWSASFSRYQRTAFLGEPRDGGAQPFDPCAGAGGGCDQIRKCRRSFCNCSFDDIAASSENGLAGLVAFRQNDLVADGGLVQCIKHVFI